MENQQRLAAMAEPLLAWYDIHKRSLPWRGTRDPYRVWVSEIMLQQTRVAAVVPYYQRWMEALPTVESLAAVDDETLMKLWQGMGYYSRARNLKRAAQIIALDRGGRFPEDRDGLLALPGVGRYTAGAVASIAFGQPVPAVDGNVLRVAARVANVGENILDPKVKKNFETWMESATPTDRPGEFNQALMDLGATVCLPGGAPDCGACPLSPLCQAHRLGLEGALPVRSRRGERRLEEMTVYLLARNGRVAMRKREPEGLLAGLWEFPYVPGALEEARAGDPLAQWGLAALEWRERLTARHLFTHVEWRMTGYVLTVKGEGAGLTWVDGPQLEQLAVPSAFSRFLAAAKDILKN